jgi:hypothetical protein
MNYWPGSGSGGGVIPITIVQWPVRVDSLSADTSKEYISASFLDTVLEAYNRVDSAQKLNDSTLKFTNGDGSSYNISLRGNAPVVNFKYGERFTGSTSTTLTTANAYISNSCCVFKNGVRLDPTTDYTQATSTTLTLSVPRLSTDIFLIDYNY